MCPDASSPASAGSRYLRSRWLVLLCGLVAGLCSIAPVAGATPPTAIVALGDSYSSGQAGRWQGNSNDLSGSRAGTDRACVMTLLGCRYEIGSVYLDGTKPPGCARSDVAEIMSASVRVDKKVNLSCSGAETKNIWRAASGGQAFKGEAPEADQLARIATQYRVKLVGLTIGGNDLGFASAVATCALGYVARTGPCNRIQGALIDARMPRAMAGVAKAIDEIRAVMRSAGYHPWDYRLVLHSYSSVLPRAAENRYPEAGVDRQLIGGCPFYDADSNWARDSIAPRIDDNLKTVALRKRVQFMDLRNAMQGRELCSKSTRLSERSRPPSPVTSEWARFLGTSAILEGHVEEEVHPNAYGQRSLGACLSLIYPRITGSWECLNTPGSGTDSMVLTRVSPVPGALPLTLRVSPRRVTARRRRCFTFRVLSRGEPVEAVTVRLGRRRGRTTLRGRVRKCLSLRPGIHRITAFRPGFRSARARIRARPPSRR
jgi:lysophospholipase L1-like esterase